MPISGYVGKELFVGRNEEHAEVVKVTFPIGFPVEGEINAACREVKGLDGIRPLGLADCVGIGCAHVVGDV